jgi:hypothetical protein
MKYVETEQKTGNGALTVEVAGLYENLIMIMPSPRVGSPRLTGVPETTARDEEVSFRWTRAHREEYRREGGRWRDARWFSGPEGRPQSPGRSG